MEDQIEIEKVRNRDGGGYRRWMDRKGKPRGKKRIFASWKQELVPGARFNNLHFSVSKLELGQDGGVDRKKREKVP